MAENQKISLLVVDDHQFIHAGLSAFCDSQAEDLEVVGLALNGQEAVTRYLNRRPDVVVMDIDLKNPGMDGIDTIKALREVDPAARIVVVSTWEDEQTVESALNAGAEGYMPKRTSSYKDVIDAVRHVNAGYRKLSPDVEPGTHNNRTHNSVHKLTRHEHEVLSLLVKGWSNGRIAAEFGFNDYTVGKYINSIFSKLGVSNRSEAVVTALKLNIYRM